MTRRFRAERGVAPFRLILGLGLNGWAWPTQYQLELPQKGMLLSSVPGWKAKGTVPVHSFVHGKEGFGLSPNFHCQSSRLA